MGRLHGSGTGAGSKLRSVKSSSAENPNLGELVTGPYHTKGNGTDGAFEGLTLPRPTSRSAANREAQGSGLGKRGALAKESAATHTKSMEKGAPALRSKGQVGRKSKGRVVEVVEEPIDLSKGPRVGASEELHLKSGLSVRLAYYQPAIDYYPSIDRTLLRSRDPEERAQIERESSKLAKILLCGPEVTEGCDMDQAKVLIRRIRSAVKSGATLDAEFNISSPGGVWRGPYTLFQVLNDESVEIEGADRRRAFDKVVDATYSERTAKLFGATMERHHRLTPEPETPTYRGSGKQKEWVGPRAHGLMDYPED